MQNAVDNLIGGIEEAPLPTKEHLFSKGLLMPFNCVNSGVRKLMFSTNLEQRLPLSNPDVPYVSTGYESQFGEKSSSHKVTDRDYTVLARIPKFSFKPYNHYFLIIIDDTTNVMDVIERSQYHHLTETFGYICDNTNIDVLHAGDSIPKGTIIHRSRAFDDHDLRMDGKNLLAMFNCSEYTTEDSIIISESASKKLSSPLVRKVDINLNANDIPLNIFGTPTNYKIIPDIDEYTKNDILCTIRREKKEEAFYAQDFNRLSQIFMSDEKITVTGKVVDIDIKCNNPELLDEIYYAQVSRYYADHIRMCQQIVDTVKEYCDGNDHVNMSYELQVLFYKCQAELNGTKFINEKVYTGTIMTLTVVEEIPADAGDKLTNRYGGKGVISKVKPDYLMPKTADGETIDIQVNICGVYGRENPGQLFEMSYTYRASKIARSLCNEFTTVQENISNILDFLEIVSPKQYLYYSKIFSEFNDEEVMAVLNSIIDDGMLYIDVDPGTDTPSLDTLIKLNERFPWINQEYILVPLVDSNGDVKYVNSRRPIIYGYIYYYRLKQHSEEKFSVTSLSATNIKNENSRNKASKVYKAQFSRTPIRFGDMELGDFSHMGIERVVEMLMLYSSSPQARMLCESAMTGDPYNVDIQLDNSSSNIQAEILETYLKTIGFRLKFIKIPKIKLNPILRNPFEFAPSDRSLYNPFIMYDKDEHVDHEQVLERAERFGKYRWPIEVAPITTDVSEEEAIALSKLYNEKHFKVDK